MIDAHFEVVSRVLNFLLELEKLLEGVIEEYDLCSSLVCQAFADLLKSLRSFQQLDDESFDIRNRPYVLSLVLHLIIKRILNELETRQYLNLNGPVCVLIVARLWDTHVACLRPVDIIWDLRRSRRPKLRLDRAL